MKNIKVIIVLLTVTMMIAACGQTNEVTPEGAETNPQTVQASESSKADNEKEEKQDKKNNDNYVMGTAVEVDGFVFNITEVQTKPMIGDRTKDNYAQENGEYFAIGSDIVKAADYEQIVFSVSVENKTDKAIHFTSDGWEARLPDGYKLMVETTGKIGEQIPSNYTASGEVIITKEKAINANGINLTYTLMDYNEEWEEVIWKVITGEYNEKDFNKKFNPKPIHFNIDLKN